MCVCLCVCGPVFKAASPTVLVASVASTAAAASVARPTASAVTRRKCAQETSVVSSHDTRTFALLFLRCFLSRSWSCTVCALSQCRCPLGQHQSPQASLCTRTVRTTLADAAPSHMRYLRHMPALLAFVTLKSLLLWVTAPSTLVGSFFGGVVSALVLGGISAFIYKRRFAPYQPKAVASI